MQKSMSNLGHSVQKWPIMIAILMAFSVIPSPIWAGWCETNQGTRLFCNGVDWATSWGEGIGKYTQRRRTGKHRSTIEMPLLTNDAVLKSGKPVVYFGWTPETGSPYYNLKVEGEENGEEKTWENLPSTFLEIKKDEFQFETGEYLVTVSTFVTDYRTGKPAKKAIEHTLTVNDQGCLNASQTNNLNLLEQQLRKSEKNKQTQKKIMAIWLARQSSRCWLEAFQYIAGEQGLEDEKSALADGKVY